VFSYFAVVEQTKPLCQADYLLKRDRGRCFMQLCFHVLSIRSWSQAPYFLTMPYIFAGALHEKTNVAKAAMEECKTMWLAILKAEEIVENEGDNFGAIKLLIGDTYFQEKPLVRKLALIAMRGNWSIYDETTQRALRDLFAGISQTKTHNEDVFNTLRDHQRKTKNKTCSLHRAYHTFHSCRLLQTEPEAGVNESESTEPLHPDRAVHLPLQDDDTNAIVGESWKGEFNFRSASHQVDSRVKIKEQLRQRKDVDWQPAGMTTLKRMTAASAYLVGWESENWKKAGRAWCCCVMKEHLVFHNTVLDTYVLSMGPAKWGFLAQPLKVLEDRHGDRYFVLDPKGDMQIYFNHNIQDTERTIWRGIPCEEVHSDGLTNRDMFKQGYSFLLMQVGVSEWIVRFSVRHGVHLVKDELHPLCTALSCLPARREDAKGDPNVAAYALALVKSLFPNEDENMWDALVYSICTPRDMSKEEADQLTIAAELDEDNKKELLGALYKFQADADAAEKKIDQLKAERQEQDGERKERKNFTPESLKKLCPDNGEGQSYISIQLSAKSVQGYYPGGLPPTSTS